MLIEKIKLEEDEKVIAILRKHWWVITTQTITVVFFAFLPPLIIEIIAAKQPLVQFLNYDSLNNVLADFTAQLSFLYALWLLGLWLTLANFWTDHYLDLWTITNKRVIVVDQRGFFNRYMSSFRLERLQNMNIEINGIIPTLLDFGTIEAETAGGDDACFIGYNMPKPRDIKSMITQAADKLNGGRVNM